MGHHRENYGDPLSYLTLLYYFFDAGWQEPVYLFLLYSHYYEGVEDGGGDGDDD